MSFDDMNVDTIWFDGEFVDWEDATTHVLSHALHYGTGVFEGIRCYETTRGPAVFRLDAHLQRLHRSCQPYGIDLPYDVATLRDAILSLIDRQDLSACYIRPIVYYGYDSLGINPQDCPVNVAIACWPWGAYLGEEAQERGVEVMVSSWRKYSSEALPTTAKTTGTYLNGLLAGEEARRNGYHEAILLNDRGTVAEGPGENLFVVRDGRIATPGIAEGILDGITRESVIQIARDLGYPVDDGATIGRGELYTADELFFSGTAVEVTPIRQVDEVVIGDGRRGAVTADIQSRFFDVVHRETEAYDEWFTYL